MDTPDDFFCINLDRDQEAPSPEQQVWFAAIHRYYEDVKAYHTWLTWPNNAPAADRGEAWRDFKSPTSPLLDHLCAMVGYDTGALKCGMKRKLKCG